MSPASLPRWWESVADALGLPTIGYPVVVRPAYTLGGTGGGFVHNDEEMQEICGRSAGLPDPSGADRKERGRLEGNRV